MSLANSSIISLICNKRDEWTLKGQMSPYYFVTSIYEFVKSMTKCVFLSIFFSKGKKRKFFLPNSTNCCLTLLLSNL